MTPDDRGQRRAALLRPLNTTLGVLSAVGLVIMVLRSSPPHAFALVGGSLLLNLGIDLLNRRGHTGFAAGLFTVWVNLGVLLLSGLNLLLDNNHTIGLVYACVLSMGVILAGLLLGVRAALLLAAFNGVAASLMLWRHYNLFGTERDDSPLFATVSAGVPIASFMIVSAVITWLYQRALDESEARLNEARQRVMQNELLRRDLAIARELQQRLYPPPPLTDARLTIASRSEPARETSGDFYDFIDLDEERLGIVVADVTGKSIAAALMMALARGTLRSAARRHSSPAEVLHHANEALCRDHSARQLLTVFYGVLHTRDLTLTFANAGHPYPFLRRGLALDELELSGLPLGARPDARYHEHVVQLEPGDQLFVLSDGLVEERNGSRELFGYERLYRALSAADSGDPERAIDDLWRAVTRFRGDTEQDDDITLLVLQATPATLEAPHRLDVAQAAKAGQQIEA